MNNKQASILIVDDDQDIRTNVKDILDDLGYRTDVACDGPSAMHLIRSNHYDVALLDFKMEGMDGASLYREIKSIAPETVAIMITAFIENARIKQALDAGTWKVMRKPIDMPELLSLIEEASDQPLVLVVDDDEDFCESIWQVLRAAGFRVSLAQTEEEGLSKSESLDFDAALVDLQLGQGDGRRVLELILKSKEHSRVLLITGKSTELGAAIQEAEKLGVRTCLKPLDMDRLHTLLKQAVSCES